MQKLFLKLFIKRGVCGSTQPYKGHLALDKELSVSTPMTQPARSTHLATSNENKNGRFKYFTTVKNS